ncbi:hydantoinase/oxoprolinase family protein [Paraburkholderia tropica]|uniref:hydantoinase/oxoprolinase family protein n=1 Tax=Paraburkholderia tropica TaxID=92647 RepID=UPI002AB5E6EB|nr:hydantoinase/oxoprolinase family protein [Paraburkholderia tropica]
MMPGSGINIGKGVKIVSMWALGIDIGGTFTDVVAVDYDSGAVRSLKVLTTPADPTNGVMNGVTTLLGEANIKAAEVVRIVHATTLFTNALIERRGSKTGLLTTAGFSDVIEIGNERKYDLYDLNIEAARPLVPRDLRGEISARLDAFGAQLHAVDEKEVRATVGALVERGIESLAICLLHSYVDSTQEKQVRDHVRKHFPDLDITISTDVAPVIREFERFSTACANAYIKPMARRYLTVLQERLAGIGLTADVLMMLSNGGLCHIDEARRVPIALLESGPAAGAISAGYFSLQDAVKDALAFDMGGTTAKLCVVEEGSPSVAQGFEAARQKRFAEGSGLPIRITTVDLIEIGAGGGSIAHLDALGLLKVGPESASSEPGPACYALGGESATVTDANLLLGYLNPDYFAGGRIRIERDLAERALHALGQQIGRSAVEVAWGVHDIVAENMAGAARVHVAERGRDPRDFVLLSTGGGGPLHAYYVAQKIGVRKIMCPPSAGVASAYGLLVAPARVDRSRTVKVRPMSDPVALLEESFDELEQGAAQTFAKLEHAFGERKISRYADGRYVGQGFTLTVQLPEGPYSGTAGLDEDGVRQALTAAFEDGYRKKFGRTPPEVAVELVNLRVAIEALPRQMPALKPLARGLQPQPKARRQVYFGEVGGYVDTPIFSRDTLYAGFEMIGPLLIEDTGSTLVVGPRGKVVQETSGNLIVEILERS